MKLRFDKNSLRLRLKKSDLQQLQQQKSVQESVTFPAGLFEYHLVISDEGEISASIEAQVIEVTIPSGQATRWIDSEEVGIYHTIQISNQQSLDIIIEKDFPCKDRSEEDTSDAFIELAEKQKSKEC